MRFLKARVGYILPKTVMRHSDKISVLKRRVSAVVALTTNFKTTTRSY